MGLKFERFFTQGFKNDSNINEVYDMVEWSKRDCKIVGKDGNTVFEMKGVLAPSFWSDNAVNIVASKYLKVNNGRQETSIREMIERVIQSIGWKAYSSNYFDTDLDCKIFLDELRAILINQVAFFNSPVWFNIGVVGRMQCPSACFLTDVEDSLESIADWYKSEMLIFKAGSGSGANISKLRSKNSKLSNGGTSSGPLSFIKGSDAIAGIIKSGGTTRRAAKMLIMNANHPDIEDFIWAKANEEKKAQALIAAGFSSGIDGDAYKTVAYQNFNSSVRFTDKEMSSHSNLLDQMAKATWQCGDPGIQFHDTINDWSTLVEENVTSNPCSEFLSSTWSSCNLASINLLRVHDSYEKLQHVVDIMITAMDILVELGEYPVEKISLKTKAQRQLGLGYANLGSLLMRLGMPYDSDSGRLLAAKLTSVMTAEAYLQSARIADAVGPFPDFRNNLEYDETIDEDGVEFTTTHNKMHSTMQKHHEKAVERFGEEAFETELWSALTSPNITFRNATTTCIAPTGTIMLAMDCDTGGIEPEIALVRFKSLVGGGEMKFVSESAKAALENLTWEPRRRILEQLNEKGIFDLSLVGEHWRNVLKTSFPNSEGESIDPIAHVKMVESVQPFVSMGISKTVNLPSNATWEDIKNVYLEAHLRGLKSISVYRDGSKGSQPLESAETRNKAISEAVEAVKKPSRRKLPDTRKSITHRFAIGGYDGYLTVGLYDDGTPGEVFVNSNKEGSTISGLLDAFGIGLSFSLQYHVPLEFLVEKFKGVAFEPSGFTSNTNIPNARSIVDYVARWLELEFLMPAYMSDAVKPTKSGNLCVFCGGLTVVTGTCYTCTLCGASGGC